MKIDEILKLIMNETDIGNIHDLAMKAYDELPDQPVETFEAWAIKKPSSYFLTEEGRCFYDKAREIWNARPKRESGYPLEYCTYIDKDGKRKFLTDFVPQVIAAYEMGVRKYQEGQYPGAVYNAMEDALTTYFLNRIEDGAIS